MWGKLFFGGTKTVCGLLAVCILLLGRVHAADVVSVYQDAKGWRLLVDGKDFYVKGVVWGYTPRNENYNYNLWGQSDDFVRRVLDYDFGLMSAAGVNAIRSFNIMPPKWIQYVYETYDIMVVINPLVGRYGATINGKWRPVTDYSDPETRAALKAETLAIIEAYKDVPGVLMFALGNESNYGLEWKSFEIENVPEGERQSAKARYLYSLFNEIIVEGKKLAPTRPFTIVNGEVQYIGLIKEIVTELDLFGVNSYRGMSFTNLWQQVEETLDLPVLFFEQGSDAFNARTFEEDQLAQARFLKSQWQEMYNKAWGNGEEGNSIGAFVFEWRDEWWKYLQEERLDIHDTNASWAAGGYTQDFVQGQNNMNEEWWGIASLGNENADGVAEAIPRMAYDVLSEVWTMDPYAERKVAMNEAFDDLDMEYLALKSDVRALKSESKEKKQILSFTGGSFKIEGVQRGTEQEVDELGDAGDDFSDGQMVFLDFGFAPTNNIDGQFTVNLLGNVANLEPLEFQYGRRGLPLQVQTIEDIEGVEDLEFSREFRDRERIEIYDFNATYRGKIADIEAFYHTPRYHWKYEGDFFGLVREATDIGGQDIWNAKAPSGIEFAGKGALDGLKIVGGPEIFWGANPKIVLKYQNDFKKTLPFLGEGLLGNTEYTLLLSEDIDRQGTGANATQATVRETSQYTFNTKTEFTDKLSLEMGAIVAALDRRGEVYTRIDDNGNLITDEIELEDTLGFRAKLNFPLFGSLAYLATHQAGLVAEGGSVLREFGTRLPYGDGLGNKREYEGGIMMNFGDWMIFPRYLYRENLVDANQTVLPEIVDCENQPPENCVFPGTIPRNRDDDPFAVLDNREAKAAELFLTYDPTGATGFYQWDNDWREDAKFAFNIGLNYTEFPTFTDSYQFFFEPLGSNPPFGVGLPPEDTWEISSRMVFNPTTNVRFITRLRTAFLQPTGEPEGGTRKFWEANGKLVIGGRHIFDGYFKKNAWGPYDFQRQFNVVFPEQFKLDYSILLDQKKNEMNSSKIGIRGLFRTNDDALPDGLFPAGENAYRWHVVFYYIFNFGGTNPPMPRN
jgi:beta-galactosidase